MTKHRRPDSTRRVKARDLGAMRGYPYMLRESDDEGSPWKSVETTHSRMWDSKLPTPGEPDRKVRMELMTVTFYDGTERVLNETDEVEVGLIEPPQP